MPLAVYVVNHSMLFGVFLRAKQLPTQAAMGQGMARGRGRACPAFVGIKQ
jgi:hypothetical protein